MMIAKRRLENAVINVISNNNVEILKNIDLNVFDDPINLLKAEEFLSDPHHDLAVAILYRSRYANDHDQVIGFVLAMHSLYSSR